MTTEEKAQAYDEILNKLRRFMAQGVDPLITRADVQDFFPELKESEDERIRKGIIRNLEYLADRAEGFVKDELKERIAWLEKQGSQKLANSAKTCKDEQKSADNVEPKFKVGDYIKHNKANIICKVISVNSGSYYVENIETNGRIELFNAEQNFHLWTIQDAKDGDVLATLAGAFIYNGNNGGGSCPGSYCGINTSGRFQIGVEHHWTGKKIHPATKEQRDVLMKAMSDAEYTFDFEKKELKKINSYCQENCKGFQETGKCFAEGECKAKREAEQKPTDEEMKTLLRTEYEKGRADAIAEIQKPAWSEEDEEMWLSVIEYVRTYPAHTNSVVDWLKNLKDRVQPQPKQEWSEEDENTIKVIIEDLEYAEKKGYVLKNNTFLKEICWLKFLRPQNRWKPSEEQMKSLDDALSLAKNCGEENAFDLRTLYEQLKKLKEE